MASRKQPPRKTNSSSSSSSFSSKKRSGGGIKKSKPRRRAPGTVVLLEIQNLQASSKLLFPKLPFQRLVRKISRDILDKEGLRFQKDVFNVLQEATESHIVSLFQDTKLVANHANRITIQPKDMHLAQRLRND
ncbi:histone H3 [Absidia repens]|uniref:Histone H3 n=1 Tax=Absidia repens TaxID=90262 RepID=A0A1X2I177_9FUNG|nr:histone H3 [Absidia repens]